MKKYDYIANIVLKVLNLGLIVWAIVPVCLGVSSLKSNFRIYADTEVSVIILIAVNSLASILKRNKKYEKND